MSSKNISKLLDQLRSRLKTAPTLDSPETSPEEESKSNKAEKITEPKYITEKDAKDALRLSDKYGIHNGTKGNTSKHCGALLKKLRTYYEDQKENAPSELYSHAFCFVNWDVDTWSSVIRKWAAKHSCKWSYTYKLIMDALYFKSLLTKDIRKDPDLLQSLEVARSSSDPGIDPEDTAECFTIQDLQRVLIYLHRNLCPSTCIYTHLLCFHLLFKRRTGYKSVIAVKEKDVCLTKDGYVHFRPPCDKTTHARVVSKRSDIVKKAIRAGKKELDTHQLSEVLRLNNAANTNDPNLKSNFSLLVREAKRYMILKVASGLFTTESFESLESRTSDKWTQAFEQPYLQRTPRSLMHVPYARIHTKKILTAKWSDFFHREWFIELQARAKCSQILKKPKVLRGLLSELCCKTGNENYAWAKGETRMKVYNLPYATHNITLFLENLLKDGLSKEAHPFEGVLPRHTIHHETDSRATKRRKIVIYLDDIDK